MEYLVALALFVAVASWLLSSYNRLSHLQKHAQASWLQWLHATHQRNEQLEQLAGIFAVCLPQGDMLPRQLRRLAVDSERAIPPLDALPHQDMVEPLDTTERDLRRMVRSSANWVENLMPQHHEATQLYLEMKELLSLQEKLALSYNQNAAQYNEALEAPTGRLVSGIFGFTPAAVLQGGKKAAHQN